MRPEEMAIGLEHGKGIQSWAGGPAALREAGGALEAKEQPES